MNICADCFHATFFPLKQRVSSLLNPQQKKVAAIVVMSFLALAALYAVAKYSLNCFKAKLLNDKASPVFNHSPLLNEIECLEESLMTKNLPDDALILIFKNLNFEAWNRLFYTNKRFNEICQHPQVMASLLERGEVPLDKKVAFAKKAGLHLTILDLKDVMLTEEELLEIFNSCPNLKELCLLDVKFRESILKFFPKN